MSRVAANQHSSPALLQLLVLLTAIPLLLHATGCSLLTADGVAELAGIHNAPDLPARNWHALTRLDENRAKVGGAGDGATPMAAMEHRQCNSRKLP